MEKSTLITQLIDWKGGLTESNHDLLKIINVTAQHNPWFTKENCFLSLNAITTTFLTEEALNSWISSYPVDFSRRPKSIGIVMAGNIPLVGFHDLLAVLCSGNKAQVKLSSKDDKLMQYVLLSLRNHSSELKERIDIVPRLTNMDAIIATGSNNTSRYFDYYFGKYPNIIRKNRGSIAVLTGNETSNELQALGIDIFRYFGLGCRNVSKLMVPPDYDFTHLLGELETFNDYQHHNKYKNNLDYNLTAQIMNQSPCFASEYLCIFEQEHISSPIATLHYEYYHSDLDLQQKIASKADDIQCIVGNGYIPFGKAQEPTLIDYADNIDTMKFLTTL